MACKSGAITLEAQELKTKILDLRKQRLSFRAIASALGCSHGYAHRIVLDYIDQLNNLAIQDTKYVRAEQKETLEALIETHWPMKHDPKSAAVILKAVDQICKLTGANKEIAEIQNAINVAQMPIQINYYLDSNDNSGEAPTVPDESPQGQS
jgi:hypothetical protein